jgi:hypothetical protein
MQDVIFKIVRAKVWLTKKKDKKVRKVEEKKMIFI